MKIAFDAKRFFHNNSGLGNYSRDIVRILARLYPENQYLLLDKKPTNKGLDIQNFSSIQVSATSGFWSRQRCMGIDAQSAKADIFHGLSGELPIKWKTTSIKKIVSIHDVIFLRYPQFYSWFDRKIHTWKFRKAIESADLVIAISEQTKRDIIQFFNTDEAKIRVVYQGCHSIFKEKLDESSLKQIKEKYQLPNQFILNVGTIEARKNLLSVVRALVNTEIPLVVVGKKTKYFQKIDHFIKKNKVHVQFLENVSMYELAGIYQLSHFLVYPSLYEGFGIPIIEAHFSGIPVIISNTSCLPEAGGKDAIYVDPLNINDLRSKIFQLWNNPEERKRRAEKSRCFVEKFQDENIANALMEVYEEVLNQ